MFLVTVLFSVGRAEACSTCQCGDPTLTLMGVEKPYDGRFRLSGEYRYRTEEVGTARVDRQELTESRFSIATAYTPVKWASLGLAIPVLSKKLEKVNGGIDKTFGLGDLELRGKFYVITAPDRSNHLISIVGGLRLPTGQEQTDAAGAPKDFDVQPGGGSWVGNAGLSYGYFRHPWSLYASSFGQFASEGHQDMEPGHAWLTSVSAQFQTGYKLGFQLGFDSMWARPDTMAGISEANTGGFLLATAPRVIFSPFMDWLIYASAQIPTINALNGAHNQGTTISAGVTYDLSF